MIKLTSNHNVTNRQCVQSYTLQIWRKNCQNSSLKMCLFQIPERVQTLSTVPLQYNTNTAKYCQLSLNHFTEVYIFKINNVYLYVYIFSLHCTHDMSICPDERCLLITSPTCHYSDDTHSHHLLPIYLTLLRVSLTTEGCG